MAEWEWKRGPESTKKNLQSRPTLDTAPDTPGPRFDYEMTLPQVEIQLEALGVPPDDPEYLDLKAKAQTGRAIVVSIEDKMGETHTGKMLDLQTTNQEYDGLAFLKLTVTMRKEQPS